MPVHFRHVCTFSPSQIEEPQDRMASAVGNGTRAMKNGTLKPTNSKEPAIPTRKSAFDP